MMELYKLVAAVLIGGAVAFLGFAVVYVGSDRRGRYD